jgi:hypothetical protein
MNDRKYWTPIMTLEANGILLIFQVEVKFILKAPFYCFPRFNAFFIKNKLTFYEQKERRKKWGGIKDGSFFLFFIFY